MVYITSLKKYFFTFLKTTAFFAVMLLIYFFQMVFYYKGNGVDGFFVSALANYGTFLFFSLPLICIIATGVYFAMKINFDKLYALRLIPIIACFNALLLLIFFVVNIDFISVPKDVTFKVYPEIKSGYINPVNRYQLYINSTEENSIKDGFLFHKNAYFISSGRVTDKQITVRSSRYIAAKSMASKNSTFAIPHEEDLFQISHTGISSFLFEAYEIYIRRLRSVFNITFSDGGIASSIIAIILMCVGFFSIVAGASFFLNDREIHLLSLSAIVILSFVEAILFQLYLSLVEVIKLGIKSPFWSVIVPSLLVGVFAGLLGFGLIQLKDVLKKRQGA